MTPGHLSLKIDPNSYLTMTKTNGLTFTEANDKMVELRKLIDGHKSVIDQGSSTPQAHQ
jgi:hypothetical protein